MNYKYLIGILISVVIVYFAITIYSGDSDYNHTNTQKPANKVGELKDAGNSHTLNQKEIINKVDTKSNDASDEISVFNEILLNKGFRSNGSRPSIKFDELEKIAESDIQKASKMIKEMAANPKDNLLNLLELNYKCSGLLENKTQLDMIFKNRPFEKSLWDSGYCARFGTDRDPFFDQLKLARQGDKLAQLTLNSELYGAIERAAINPKLTPIEYNDLRNEVARYLQDLSARGVSLASLKLSREYLNDTQFFPADKVLSFFYLKLYERQHKRLQDFPWNKCYSDSDYCKSPDELYQTLTEAEKSRADGMLKRMRYSR